MRGRVTGLVFTVIVYHPIVLLVLISNYSNGIMSPDDFKETMTHGL